MKQAKERLKAASVAVQAMEENKKKALAACEKDQGSVDAAQNEVEAVVQKSAEARERANKGRIAAIEAAKEIVAMKKEASERYKEVQVIEEELKFGNKAAALKDAKESLQRAKQRMHEAKEREKEALKSVKAREQEALKKVKDDREAEKQQQAILRQKDQEKKAEIKRLAMEEKSAAKAASMLARAGGTSGTKAASPGKRVSQDID